MFLNKVAVIQFPGSNCEYETQRAISFYGMACDILRWNTPRDILMQYGAYVLPGGFSYQDRIRSGAIAARLPILDVLFEASAMGKLILGICNGCQILCETGLIPDRPNAAKKYGVEVALTHNEINGQRIGFKCDWTFVRTSNPEKSLFTRYFDSNDILPIPINHGEGRFVVSPEATTELKANALFQYCDNHGQLTAQANPNGTSDNIAGISNSNGNVFAMMPHPERAAFLKQVPDYIQSPWSDNKTDRLSNGDINGPWEKLFVSMRDHLVKVAVPA